MYFYDYVYSFTFILLNLNRINSSNNADLHIVSKTGPLTINSVGLQFLVMVNNTSEHSYDVELVPDQCCLDGQKQDCDILEIVGHCLDVIPEGTIKTMKLIAPLLNPFDRKGFCTVYLDSKPTNGQRNMMRDTHRINFDTKVKIEDSIPIPNNMKVVPCINIDEDPLNNCKPVDCETYYNGRRSYLNEKLKRCVDVPICDQDDDVVYNPVSNVCNKGDLLIKEDIDFIKSLSRKPKDIVIIKKLHNASSLRKGSKKPHEDDNSILNNISKTLSINRESFCCRWKKFLKQNKCTLIVLGTIILIQCCLINSMIYYLCNNCKCRKKKVIRKYFNYRQDASVTTPLIGTSNIDTETTEYQYLSESSNNIDKKIKCYKSCQKLFKNNIKLSMSDDILSKCFNRRDWNRKLNKPGSIIPEIHIPKTEENITQQIKEVNEDIISIEPKEVKKSKETKVNFETENVEIIEKPKEIKEEKCEKKQNKIVRSIVTKLEKKCSREKKPEKKAIDKNINDLRITSSEKEIKCHNYNYVEAGSNLTNFKPSTQSKGLGCYKVEKKKETISLSTEKGAQAYFSNDSIDDFLSERGMIFLADENTSKYSYSSESNGLKGASSSEVSSKTSKNNVVKNVLSLFHKKAKHAPSSDPGVKKTDNVEVELIHMSHASIYSSSNNDSEYFAGFKKPKDSRTSL